MVENILKETPINNLTLKEELEKIKKRDKELNFRAERTEEYLKTIDISKSANDIAAKIEKLKIPRLKDMHINKIVDIMPSTVKDLKIVLQGYTLTINNENAKKIIDTINKSL